MSNRPPDERGVSPVAGKRRLFRSAKARKVALAGGTVAAVGFVVLGLNAAVHDKGPVSKPADTGSSVIAQVTQTPPPPPAPAPPPPQPEPKVVYVHDRLAAPAQHPAVVSGSPDYVRMPTAPAEEAFAVPPPKHNSTDAATGGHNALSGAPGAASTTRVAFKPSIMAGGKAGPAIRLTYLMMPQLIPCALDTAMDSTLAGAIMCHTTQDVLSPDHVLLMPAGTLVVGTYKNDIRQGQSRLFAFAGNAITREGIPIPLDSQVADGLGRAGIEGSVNNHFFERFGAGLLLAGSQSALQLAQAMVSKGGNSYFQLNSGGGGTDVATEILRQQENVAPTISVPPGTIVSIVVDHPIDFSDAIKVRAIR
jgi:type IV secretion system protein VirB10